MDIIPIDGHHAPRQLCHVYERRGWRFEDVIRLFVDRYHYEPARVWVYKTPGGVECVCCEVRQ